MSSPSLPVFDVVQSELVALAVGMDADDLHGSLCGFLAAGGASDSTSWPEGLALDAIAADRLRADQPLGELFAASVAQLNDDELGFQLLLPDDAALDNRAEALLAWCRGFIGGFGLAGGRTASDDAQEALADLGRIAATVLSFEDAEQDAQSLEELVEFVRIAVLLLNSEREPVADDDSAELPKDTLH